MTKLYYFNGAHHGHVNPTLGPVRELVRRGNEVIYFADEAFRPAIERTGAAFRAYSLQPPRETISEANQFAAYLLEYSAALLPELIEQSRADRPASVIFDMLRPWGWLLGRKLHVPVMCSSPSFVLTPPVLQMVAPEFLRNVHRERPSEKILIQRQRYAAAAAAISARYRVESPSISEVLAMTGDATLVFTTRSLQPAAHVLDRTVHFIGPSLQGRSDVPDVAIERRRGRRRVFVSLGTIFNDRAEFFRNCIRAFAHTDYEVTMAVGHTIDLESFGETPTNFTIRHFVPQLEVLKQTDVFLTHGGMGSVHEALSFGVPMVLYPQMIEQSIVAHQIATLEAGIQLTTVSGVSGLVSEELVGAGAIREAVECVVRDPSFARNTRRIACEFPRDTPARFADMVSRFATDGHLRAA